MLKIFSRHKDFGLALGGGAARGLAHIGIIKFLEENDLRPSEISGTSMGSIIGALYAFGKTSDEMREIVSQINFLKLIDFNMRRGLIAGNKIKKYLIGIFGDIRIEELKIPIKIISTDISSGEKMIFDSGNLVDAIRSSISIPGIIMPYALGNKEFVDGGLINNLPIEVLAEKNILAVSVLRDISRPLKSKLKFMGFEMKHNVFGMNYQILQKAIDIMMKQNEDRSLHSGKNVILLHPNFPGIDYYEFNKYDEIINIGYKWAHSEKEKFKELL